jgi:hypothetical protein
MNIDPLTYLAELQDEAQVQGRKRGIRQSSFNYTLHAWVDDKSEVGKALRKLAERNA